MRSAGRDQPYRFMKVPSVPKTNNAIRSLQSRVAWKAAKKINISMNGAKNPYRIVVNFAIYEDRNKHAPAPNTFASANDQIIV